MALPKIQTAWAETKITTSKRKLHIRPFTVGEQKKILLIKDQYEKKDNQNVKIYEAVIELMKNCIKESINPADLYPVDFQKLFFDIRTISDSAIVEFTLDYITDTELAKQKEDEKYVPKESQDTIEIDTQQDLKIINDVFNKTFEMKSQGMSIEFRQLKMKDMILIEKKKYKSEEDKSFDVITYCLDKVITADEVFDKFTHEEAVEFIDELPEDVFKDIASFFEKQPKLVCTKTFNLIDRVEPYTLSEQDMSDFLS